jgi:hypothetical protein
MRGCFQPFVGGTYYYRTSQSNSGLYDSDGALNFCAYSVRVSTSNILRSFVFKAPAVAAGATLALADVYDAAASAFVAPVAGLYSLTYNFHIGLPFQYNNFYDDEFYGGAASLWAVVDGERQLVERMDGGAHSVDHLTYGITFPVLHYADFAGSRKNVRSGSATMLLAAGARVTVELLFQAYSNLALGMLWTGTRLRFSLLVPY